MSASPLRRATRPPARDLQDVAAVGEQGAGSSPAVEPSPGVRASPGALDLYRDLVEAVRSTLDAARRRRLAIIVELSMIAAYALLRTADVGRGQLTLWTAAAIAISVLSPVSGLVILAAIAPFSEPFTVTRQLGVKPFLVVALAAGVLLRLCMWAIGWMIASRSAAATADQTSSFVGSRSERALVGLSLVSAAAVFLGTALGVIHTRLAFSPDLGVVATESWLAGIGGGLLVLFVAAWVGYTGTVRPVVAAIASSVIGAVVSLVDFFDPTGIRGGAFDWLVRPGPSGGRLAGIIPSPNGVEALLIAPFAVLVGVAVLARDWRMRLASAIAAVPMAIALYFTYSRAALIGGFLIAVVVAWKIRPRLGAIVLTGGIIVGLLLLPTYLRARGEVLGPLGAPNPGELFVATDAYRLQAWEAAGKMWMDAPLTGQGFMSYQILHESYGDPILRSPHNEWVRLFAEEGVVVGLAGLAFIGFTAAALARARGAPGAGIFAGFLCFVVAATFNNPFLFVQVLAIASAITGIGLGHLLRPEVRGTGEVGKTDDGTSVGDPGH